MLSTAGETYYAIENGRVVRVPGPDAPIIVYDRPSEDQRADLIERLQIDEHALQSALDPDELARLEFEPTHAAIILKRANRVADDTGQEFRVASIGAFLFEDRLVLVHTDDFPLFEGRRPQAPCLSVRGALLQVISQSIAQFARDVRLIQRLSQSIEEHIDRSVSNEALASMFDLQKGLVYYQSALQSNQLLLVKLRSHAARIGFSPDERDVLDDAIVDNEQCLKLVEMYSYILTGMSDARVSIISNNLNVIMKKLTIISIIFMPLNVIASMFGMSEYTVFTRALPWPVSYALFTAVMVLIGYVTWLFIRNIGAEPHTPRPSRPRRRLRDVRALLSATLRH